MPATCRPTRQRTPQRLALELKGFKNRRRAGILRYQAVPAFLCVLLAACNQPFDEVVGLPEPGVSRIDGRPLDQARLADLRRTGEGCAVTAPDPHGLTRGFAVPRSHLPFAVPAIVRDPRSGLGNGRVVKIVVDRRGGSAVTLECWVPGSFVPEALVAAVSGSLDGERWGALLTSLETARDLTSLRDRTGVDREAREFKVELVGRELGLRAGDLAPPGFELGCESGGEMNRAPADSPRGSSPASFNYNCYCFEWTFSATFSNGSWYVEVTFSFCMGTSGSDYEGMVAGGYWQWPCGGNVRNERDLIRGEYGNVDYYTGTWVPDCNDLVSGVHSPQNYFTWDEIRAHGPLVHDFQGDKIGVFSPVMLGGIDAVREAWGDALYLTSNYRCPQRNNEIGSTALQSRHMYGDAVDFRNPNQGQSSEALYAGWEALREAAISVPGARVPSDPQCDVQPYPCVHVDWKYSAGNPDETFLRAGQ